MSAAGTSAAIAAYQTAYAAAYVASAPAPAVPAAAAITPPIFPPPSTYQSWAGPWEVIQIQGDNITPSLLVWRRYKRPAPGVLENFLDFNPLIIEGLSLSPYLPVGSIVRMPIDAAVIAGAPVSVKQATLMGTV